MATAYLMMTITGITRPIITYMFEEIKVPIKTNQINRFIGGLFSNKLTDRPCIEIVNIEA